MPSLTPSSRPDRSSPRSGSPAGTADGAAATDVFAAFGRWRLLDDREHAGPAVGVMRDRALAEAVTRGTEPPTLRVWRNARALVVTRRETRLPRFDEAVSRLAAQGWPVVVRDSGGGAVPHGAGILNLSMMLPRRDAPTFSVGAVYRALCAPLRRALGGLGIETAYGETPGAFCDGRFNLVAGDRKIAGTAQRWCGGLAGISGPPRLTKGYVLAHAVLLVDPDLGAATAALNSFYAVAGAVQRVDPRACTTVRACLAAAGRPAPRAPLTEFVRRRLLAAAERCLERHRRTTTVLGDRTNK